MTTDLVAEGATIYTLNLPVNLAPAFGPGRYVPEQEGVRPTVARPRRRGRVAWRGIFQPGTRGRCPQLISMTVEAIRSRIRAAVRVVDASAVRRARRVLRELSAETVELTSRRIDPSTDRLARRLPAPRPVAALPRPGPLTLPTFRKALPVP